MLKEARSEPRTQFKDSQTISSLALEEAIHKTRHYLLQRQNGQGYWVGELEADASVSAGYIWLMYYMTGQVDPLKQKKVVDFVLSQQNPDGSWSAFAGGPGDLNVTIQVYFSLKLAGMSASEANLQRARQFVLSRGGVMQANTITRIWLATFGQYDYRGTPSIPPEIALWPNWFYMNIYEFASWSRETILALMIILALKPVCQVAPEAGISELYLEPPEKRVYRVAGPGQPLSWANFFLTADRLFKVLEKQPVKPFRQKALKKVEDWVVEHQEQDGSWGGIMLPWIYSLMALKALGYPATHPVIVKGLAGLEVFIIENNRALKMQPAVSPVWDTAWATLALLESGLPSDHPAIRNSAGWLLKHEIRQDGDWKIKNPGTQAGCWAFEFDNRFYPDIDDTAVVARVLLNLSLPPDQEAAKKAAVHRGYDWVCRMQSKDGGWAAFDRDNDRQILANVPYADFMTPLDPPSADVTAHAMELISCLDKSSPSLKRAIQYLKKTQESDGAWYGRWGVNYIYGTGLTLVGLKRAGEDMSQEYITRAVRWLETAQNGDGGWGETCETYTDPSLRGKGPSTASQTAWALMGLLAAGPLSSTAVTHGIEYLLNHQEKDGAWIEEAYTGTGFPRAFYLRYDLYRIYFPLLVLSQYRKSLEVNHGN